MIVRKYSITNSNRTPKTECMVEMGRRLQLVEDKFKLENLNINES